MQIELRKGDITKMDTDAIVNAANKQLKGGGGVDGAIHRAGGPAILEECRQIIEERGPCPVGEAVITTAGELKTRKVIHTVGPFWTGGDKGEAEKLKSCYLNSLRLAAQHGLETIAFPNISTGAYRYPKEEAAEIAILSVREADVEGVKRVVFVCYDKENYSLYQKMIEG